MSELLQAIERGLQHCNVTKIADMNEPSQPKCLPVLPLRLRSTVAQNKCDGCEKPAGSVEV